METYSMLRQLADSWVLLVLFLFFAGVILWVFRPGASKTYENPANIPFRHEDKPARRHVKTGSGTDDSQQGEEKH